MNTSSSGSPNTPSSHISFPYSTTATAATSTHTLPSSTQPSIADGASPGKFAPGSMVTVLPSPATKPRAQSTGHAPKATRAHPSFSPPYPTAALAGSSTTPQRPSFSRRKTSASSGGQSAGKDKDKGEKDEAEGSGAKFGVKRASKACENCRLRRRKCSPEQRPCKACVEIGLGASCVFRAKARPNRALPKVVDAQLSLDSLILDPPLMLAPSQTVSPMGTGISHAHPVRDIDLAVESWLAEQGHTQNLRLYDPPSLLTDLAMRSLPPLLSPAAETHAVHSFLDSTARYFSFLHGPRLLEMLRMYHLAPPHLAFFASTHQTGVTSPGGLRPDERALVYAGICLGRFKEVPPSAGGGVQVQVPDVSMRERGSSFGNEASRGSVDDSRRTVPLSVRLREMREDSGYFCRAMLELQTWGGASLIALGALHCLHLFTLLSGGAAEMRDVLGRMVWQVRELGLHRADSVSNFPIEDRVERLFYTTLHEDNWFATLLDAPPFIQSNTYDPSLTPSWDREGIDGERWIDQHPCVVQLTMFENELLTAIHTMPELSQGYILDLEARLADWMKVFREEQLAVPSWMLHTYANIRFHWVRIMLRAPLLSHPHFRLSSLATVCRSASQILLSYHSFSNTPSFLPTWGECRRILTAAHIVVLGHWEGEFAMMESEFLSGVALALTDKLEGGCAFAGGAKQRLSTMFGLLGIAPRKPGQLPPPGEEPVSAQPEPHVVEVQQMQQAPLPSPPLAQPVQYSDYTQHYQPLQPLQSGAYQIHPLPEDPTMANTHLSRSHGASPLHPHVGLPDVGLQHTFAPPLRRPSFDSLTTVFPGNTGHAAMVPVHEHTPLPSAQQSVHTSPHPPHAQVVSAGSMYDAQSLGLAVDTDVPRRPPSAHSLAHLSAGSGSSGMGIGMGGTSVGPVGIVPAAAEYTSARAALAPTPAGVSTLGESQLPMVPAVGVAAVPAPTSTSTATEDAMMDEDSSAWLDPWLEAMLWGTGSDGASSMTGGPGGPGKWQGQ